MNQINFLLVEDSQHQLSLRNDTVTAICAELVAAKHFQHIKHGLPQIATASCVAEASDKLEQTPFDVILLDLELPLRAGQKPEQRAGLELLRLARGKRADCLILVVSAYREHRPEVWKYEGEFIDKPAPDDAIRAQLLNYLVELDRRRGPLARLQQEAATLLVGTSPAMRRVHLQIAQLAPFNSIVLLLGEPGTGKNQAARTIHALSRRGHFEEIDLAGRSKETVHAEIFGSRKGVFTDVGDSLGALGRAGDGTAFLDEIGKLPVVTRDALYQVLRTGFYQPVGGASTKLGARLILATEHNLDDLVRSGDMLQSFLDRVKRSVIRLPPLRDRREDIEPLIDHFLAQLNAENKGRTPVTMHPDCRDYLREERDYPGNVGGLEGLLGHLYHDCLGDMITMRHVIAAVAQRDGSGSSPTEKIKTAPQGEKVAESLLKQFLAAQGLAYEQTSTYKEVHAQVELALDWLLLPPAMKKHDWKIAPAAADLGIDRKNLTDRLTKIGLKNPSDRDSHAA